MNLSLYRHIRVHLFPKEIDVIEVRFRGLSTNKQLIHKNPPAIGVLHSLKLTANAPENGPNPKRKPESSLPTIQFQVQCLAGFVSGSVILLTLPAIDAWKQILEFLSIKSDQQQDPLNSQTPKKPEYLIGWIATY